MISKEMYQIFRDFVRDLLTTFPECKESLHPGLKAINENRKDDPEVENVVEYCKKFYPSKFFDILYQKEEVFSGEEPLFFLPGIDFRNLWKLDISDKTRTIIWKYLQLILFSVVNLQESKDTFGDTAKLFEVIDEKEFKNKLEETIKQMTDIFNIDPNTSATDASQAMPLPNIDDLQNHISSMLDGNLGNLAREIAEETAEELTEDMDGVTTVGDVFKKLFRNPGKLMQLVKKVGSKLDTKLQSGEMKESDLIEEATNLIGKMNKMPGMKEMNQMLGKMGMGGHKMNIGALQAKMAQNMRMATTRERLQQKLAMKQQASMTTEGANPPIQVQSTNNPKKKKRRRKKRKNKK
jgi:hypothetical protein